MRYLKYVIVSAFCFILFSIGAFAADSPVVATVNGYGYTSLSDALAVATSGDNVTVVSDTIISSSLNIPSGVNFNVPFGVTINFSGPGCFYNYGNASLSGSFVSSDSSSPAYLFRFLSGTSYITGRFYSSVSSVPVGIPPSADSSVLVSIYSGFFSGSVHGIKNSLNSGNLIIYGGEFVPSIDGPYTLASGSSFVPGEPGTVISWGPLYQIGQLVSSAISWLVLFLTAIVSNKLLLIWLLVIFVGLGIGLIKRICRS